MTHWAYTEKRDDVISKTSKTWPVNFQKRPFKKNGKIVSCPICGKETYFKKARLKLGARFCSRHCCNEWKKSIPENEHSNWKGNSVGYFGVHVWLKKHYKKTECEKCGSVKNIQWANLSGKYKRDINDFVQLCPSCHKLFDLSKRNEVK